MKAYEKAIMTSIIAVFIIGLVGCGDDSFNLFSEIDKRPETIQVLYFDGIPYLDKDEDSDFETPTTQMELDILAANGTHIQIMNVGGVKP